MSRSASFLIVIFLLAALLPRVGGAQEARTPVARAGSVHGTIVDAQSALPLADATVVLEAGARVERTARTGADGIYRFGGLGEGRYRLRVQRIGYRPWSVEVVLRGPAESSVSVGLEVAPVALEPVEARREAVRSTPNPFELRPGEREAASEARADAERERQRTQAAPDVRVITRADVEEGVPLAETDLFRALQRLPGIAARDDYTAELWTRGAQWDHTRVYFDGVPLFNPVHTFGLFSGLNADGVGAMTVHPGAQPVASPGGAAASLDVRSRRGGARGPLSGSAELSLTSARVALDGAAGRHAWMIAARSSHGDWFTEPLAGRAHDQDVWTTRHFADVVARYDLRLSARSALETSALAQYDVLDAGPDVDWTDERRPRWASVAARATLRFPLGAARASLGVTGSGFDATVLKINQEGGISPNGTLFSWPSPGASASAVWQWTAEGRAEEAAAPGAAPAWAAGAGIASQGMRYDGAPTFPADLRLPPDVVQVDGGLTQAFAWVERRWRPRPELALEAGLRLDGGPILGADPLRPAPRFAARWQAAPDVSVAAAVGRSWQYVQAGPQLGTQGVTQQLWLVAGRDVPALRSDVATLGAEAWLGHGWLASATAYARHSAGVAVLDPRPGIVIGRSSFVTGEMAARGMEIGARKLEGRWTASASYSLGSASTTAQHLRFASEADQRHALDLAARVDVGAGLRAGAAFTASSGAAVTRFYRGSATCTKAGDECRWTDLPRMGDPGGLRGQWYASLDLLVEWGRALGRWRIDAYAQLHNALDRENPARYSHSVRYVRCGYGEPDPDGGCTDDVWSTGLPRFPAAGIRVSF
ncbi:MAG TPA: TonB-dependent receptor [Longimicrobium sp.]|nr:TonB-dependent receptor [Longimicrobium sp.]